MIIILIITIIINKNRNGKKTIVCILQVARLHTRNPGHGKERKTSREKLNIF